MGKSRKKAKSPVPVKLLGHIVWVHQLLLHLILDVIELGKGSFSRPVGLPATHHPLKGLNRQLPCMVLALYPEDRVANVILQVQIWVSVSVQVLVKVHV